MDINRLKIAAEKAKKACDGLSRSIIARVAGVSFEGRQDVLPKLNKSCEFKLERDRRNKHDFYAVKVMALIDDNWEHVGFIPKKMSKMISQNLDTGTELSVEFYRLTGGFICQITGDKANHGLEIRIQKKNYGDDYGEES